MIYEFKPKPAHHSKTVVTGLATVVAGIIMGTTGYAIPADAAQLIATGLIGVFLRVAKD